MPLVISPQIFELLEWLQQDQHPDAHSCRLKIILATAASQKSMRCPWGIESEVVAYCSYRQFVSASCRLSLDEERHMLQLVPSCNDLVVTNRRKVCLCGESVKDMWRKVS